MAKDKTKVGGSVPGSPRLEELYRRPGFMIRRCHQIAVSIFADECREFDLTTTQYGILYVLNHYSGIDQISLARLLGLDRSTTGMVVGRLEERDLLRRAIDPTDKRKRLLELTPAGENLLMRVQPVVRRAQERLLAPFNAEEQQMLTALLDRMIDLDQAEEKQDTSDADDPRALAEVSRVD